MKEKIIEVMDQLVAKAAFELRDDVKELLDKAAEKETVEAASNVLAWIKENADIANREKLALCQDTGLAIVYLEAGKDVSIDAELIDLVKEGASKAYAKYYLRPSAVEALTRTGSAYDGVIVKTSFDSSKTGLKITLLSKGFGSENKTKLCMFNPTASIESIEDFILEAVKDAGPEACPPFVIGVGIGGTSDYALQMAKEAYLEDLRLNNKDSALAKIEDRLLNKINGLEIGPMGMGGSTSALAIKLKQAKTHIAGLPVGVNINCWATRSASVLLEK